MTSGCRETWLFSLLSSRLGSLVTSEGYLISFSFLRRVGFCVVGVTFQHLPLQRDPSEGIFLFINSTSSMLFSPLQRLIFSFLFVF